LIGETQMTEQSLTKPENRQSLLVSMASKYQMDPDVFKNTIKATVMPAGATNEQMAAFLLVANHYDLNPITKEIYAFPAKGGGVTPVVGIDGWVNLAQRHAQFDGVDFAYGDDSVTCRVYRKDRSHPIVVTEFMDECRRNTDPWKTHPKRMLRHKALIQAIRYAFGFAGIKDEDDAEVIAGHKERVITGSVVDLNAKLEKETSQTNQAIDAVDNQYFQLPSIGELIKLIQKSTTTDQLSEHEDIIKDLAISEEERKELEEMIVNKWEAIEKAKQ